MDKDYFYFKKFKLRNQHAALKVNTDGVLLGAWADTSQDKSILDVGTGSGVIALMLSQRFQNSNITAIDIEQNSYEEASFNFKLNEASNILAQHISFQALSSKEIRFDHIVSNPPYFQNNTRSLNSGLEIAKHNSKLNFEDFWHSSIKLINTGSKISVVLPIEESISFSEIGKRYNFDKHRALYVCPKVNDNPKRVLIEFRHTSLCKFHSESIYLHENGNRNYSEAYRKLTKDFYLKF